MDRTRVLQYRSNSWRVAVFGIGLMMLALLTVACSGTASGNPVSGSLNGASQSQADELARMSGIGGPGYGGGTGIHASGVGVVTVTPDVAVLSLGVEGFASTVAEARAIAAEAMEGTIQVLEDAGVSDEDIQTQYFNIHPEYRYEEVLVDGNRRSEQRLVGYRVTNSLSVKIRDLDNVGNIIDGAVEAGGDATRINGIHFTLEDGAEAEEEARVLALQDAREKAELYASELGVSRGDLAYVSETSAQRYPMTSERAAFDGAMPAMEGASTSIMPGETDVRVTVQVVFDINN
ncbi:MAG: SIMPL domain-containing protein [Dehalococcoidia bacterium]